MRRLGQLQESQWPDVHGALRLRERQLRRWLLLQQHLHDGLPGVQRRHQGGHLLEHREWRHGHLPREYVHRDKRMRRRLGY